MTKLKAYHSVSVQQRNIFPGSPIYQISLENEITDDDLAFLVTMPELKEVTHVYIKNCKVTDDSLAIVEQWSNIEYIFIESKIITDDAIIEFERKHPECIVIPYGR